MTPWDSFVGGGSEGGQSQAGRGDGDAVEFHAVGLDLRG